MKHIKHSLYITYEHIRYPKSTANKSPRPQIRIRFILKSNRSYIIQVYPL